MKLVQKINVSNMKIYVLYLICLLEVQYYLTNFRKGSIIAFIFLLSKIKIKDHHSGNLYEKEGTLNYPSGNNFFNSLKTTKTFSEVMP